MPRPGDDKIDLRLQGRRQYDVACAIRTGEGLRHALKTDIAQRLASGACVGNSDITSSIGGSLRAGETHGSLDTIPPHIEAFGKRRDVAGLPAIRRCGLPHSAALRQIAGWSLN